MFDYFEPYLKEFSTLIGIPENHIYEYGESAFRPVHCLETIELQEYGGCETVYTDKDFTWLICHSHEDTVAFAGTIVPKIKELLKKEEEH